MFDSIFSQAASPVDRIMSTVSRFLLCIMMIKGLYFFTRFTSYNANKTCNYSQFFYWYCNIEAISIEYLQITFYRKMLSVRHKKKENLANKINLCYTVRCCITQVHFLIPFISATIHLYE